MRTVETNVLVRLLTGDDRKQLALAEAFVAPGAWISHVVLSEAIWVLDSVFSASPQSLAQSIQMLLEHDTLVLQDSDVVEAALAHFVARPALGFTRARDCSKGRPQATRYLREGAYPAPRDPEAVALRPNMRLGYALVP